MKSKERKEQTDKLSGLVLGDYNPLIVCYNFCMQVVLVIFSVVLLGVIINYAVSPKSSRLLRMAALIALVLIALSLGIATLFIFLNNSSKDTGEGHLPIFLEAPRETPNRQNLVEIIVFLVFFAVVFGIVIVTALKDHKRRLAEAKKAGALPSYQKADKTADLDLKPEEPHDKAKDDEFSLDM